MVATAHNKQIFLLALLNFPSCINDLVYKFKKNIDVNSKVNYQGGIPKLRLRVLLKAMIPTTQGNQMVKDPNFLKNIENYINMFNCEASYFTEMDGNRTFIFVLDLPNTDMIPAIAEPLFQGYDADVEIHPAMNFDDLKNAISKMQR